MSNAERITKILESDGAGVIRNTLTVAKSDITALLAQFMDVRGVSVCVDSYADGYTVTVTVKASRIYDVGKTSMRA